MFENTRWILKEAMKGYLFSFLVFLALAGFIFGTGSFIFIVSQNGFDQLLVIPLSAILIFRFFLYFGIFLIGLRMVLWMLNVWIEYLKDLNFERWNAWEDHARSVVREEINKNKKNGQRKKRS